VWHSPKNRSYWLHTDNIITQWLKERQALLVAYTQLCQSDFEQGKITEPELLQSFCQLLIDYVSVGHFKVFEKIAAAEESVREGSELDKTLLTGILRSTLLALDFNDAYETAQHSESLLEDLSMLGQQLAQRMDWEDQLIKNYLHVTTENPRKDSPKRSAASL
jgi:regulator of sigma D